jgi:hypothetical protein
VEQQAHQSAKEYDNRDENNGMSLATGSMLSGADLTSDHESFAPAGMGPARG